MNRWWVLVALVAVLPIDAAGQMLAPYQVPSTKTKTGCKDCHSTQSFSDVAAFPHHKTGFPLRGAHLKTGCKECHRTTYKAPIERSCHGCHRDPHVGSLGFRCEQCHDEVNWRSTFQADAHRRTNFPLFGKHAFLPCAECHGDVRERRFVRTTVPCAGCHVQELSRAGLAGVDHGRMAMGENCQTCHDGWRWSPARFPQHDACFPISAGPHSGMACKSCHSTVPQVPPGNCALATTACISCHTHQCTTSDAQHVSVPGYSCNNTSCYSCHRLAGQP
jgi:hypothetical protein